MVGGESKYFSMKKLIPGKTLKHCHNESEMMAEDGCMGKWTHCEGSSFKVRKGPEYSTKRLKDYSGDTLYTPVSIDVYSCPSKVPHISRYLDFDQIGTMNHVDGWIHGLPRYLVIHVMCPSYSPGLFNTVKNGNGYFVTAVCEIKESIVQTIEKGTHSPAVKLLQRFAVADDHEMMSRFKGIVRANNIDSLPLNYLLCGLMRSFNSTPFLLRSKTNTSFHRGPNYLEIDADVHLFNAMSRQAFYHTHEFVRQIDADYAFLVEAREDDELPECIFTAFNIKDLENIQPKAFPDHLMKEMNLSFSETDSNP